MNALGYAAYLDERARWYAEQARRVCDPDTKATYERETGWFARRAGRQMALADAAPVRK